MIEQKMNYTHDNPVRAMIVGKLNIASKPLDIASKDMNFLNTYLNVVN